MQGKTTRSGGTEGEFVGALGDPEAPQRRDAAPVQVIHPGHPDFPPGATRHGVPVQGLSLLAGAASTAAPLALPLHEPSPLLLLKSTAHLGIGGFGVYTKVKIPKGKRVCEYKGELIDQDEADKRALLRKADYIICCGCDDDSDSDSDGDREYEYIDAASSTCIARWINHRKEDDANAYALVVEGTPPRPPRIYIHAKRSIPAGTQLFIDYGSNYDFPGKVVGKKTYGGSGGAAEAPWPGDEARPSYGPPPHHSEQLPTRADLKRAREEAGEDDEEMEEDDEDDEEEEREVDLYGSESEDDAVMGVCLKEGDVGKLQQWFGTQVAGQGLHSLQREPYTLDCLSKDDEEYESEEFNVILEWSQRQEEENPQQVALEQEFLNQRFYDKEEEERREIRGIYFDDDHSAWVAETVEVDSRNRLLEGTDAEYGLVGGDLDVMREMMAAYNNNN
jgi:hypothetical protein